LAKERRLNGNSATAEVHHADSSTIWAAARRGPLQTNVATASVVSFGSIGQRLVAVFPEKRIEADCCFPTEAFAAKLIGFA
jgi:hypothetical protein